MEISSILAVTDIDIDVKALLIFEVVRVAGK